MHTEALAGRGDTCRWMSAAAGASGDRVLAIMNKLQTDAARSRRRPRVGGQTSSPFGANQPVAVVTAIGDDERTAGAGRHDAVVERRPRQHGRRACRRPRLRPGRVRYTTQRAQHGDSFDPRTTT